MAVISVVRVLIEAKTSAREGLLMVLGWLTEVVGDGGGLGLGAAAAVDWLVLVGEDRRD